MLRISVCDDEPEQLERMARLAEAYLAARPELTGTVARFDSGRALLAAAEAGDGFELCLLDVIMPPPDGIETGLRLRELGEDGEIIYLTASDGYAVDSYDVRAFFYLLKPVEQKRLFRVLDQAVDKLRKRREEAVVVPTRGGARRVRHIAQRGGARFQAHDHVPRIARAGADLDAAGFQRVAGLQRPAVDLEQLAVLHHILGGVEAV